MSERLKAGVRKVVTIAQAVSGFNKRDWQRTAEARIAVNLLKSEPWLDPLLESWSLTNAQLISSIESTYLDRVAARTADMIRQGRSINEYREELQSNYDLTRGRAQVIARTEVAKLNGQITKARQEHLGITEYVWRTAGDERVRDSHKVLNGKFCKWGDPGVYRDEGSTTWKPRSGIGGFEGDPGQDFQCRCAAAANIEDLLQRLGI
jgi:SPP1 gp7 family putative phage head morphogenesis protein